MYDSSIQTLVDLVPPLGDLGRAVESGGPAEQARQPVTEYPDLTRVPGCDTVCRLSQPHPTVLALSGQSAGLVLVGAFGVSLAVYVVVISAIAWRAHRNEGNFDNNIKLLRLLLAALPWRRGFEEERGDRTSPRE